MKKLVFLLVFALLLAGCETIGTFEDAVPMSQGLSLMKADQGYFFQMNVMVDGFYTGDVLLYQLPVGEQEPRPWCQDPECAHNSEDCEAFVKCTGKGLNVSSTLSWYRNQLCMLCLRDRTVTLVGIDPVSRERTVLCTVDPFAAYPEAPDIVSVRGSLTGNTLALLYSTEEPKEGGNHRLEAVDLVTGKSRILFSEHFDLYADNEYMRVFGEPVAVDGKLYVQEHGLGSLPESSKSMPEGQITQFDLETGEVRQILRKEIVTAYSVEGDTLYYSDQKEGVFRELDLATGESRTIPFDRPVYGRCYYEKDRIIEWDTLEDPFEEYGKPGFIPGLRVNVSFYTRDYQPIRTIWFSDGTYPAYTTEEGILFLNNEDTEFTFLSWGDLETAQIGNQEPQDREPRNENGVYVQG